MMGINGIFPFLFNNGEHVQEMSGITIENLLHYVDLSVSFRDSNFAVFIFCYLQM